MTEPGGNLIHINVEQVTSVRSTTQIPGAKAQLDLASGKLQGVQENADQVMQLIMATAGALWVQASDPRRLGNAPTTTRAMLTRIPKTSKQN